MASIFISYAREDAPLAERLRSDLALTQHDIWMDAHELVGGCNFDDVISKAIETADYFIALISEHSFKKWGYIQKEWRIAADVEAHCPPGVHFIIPCRLSNVEPAHACFAGKHRIDMFNDWFGGVLRILKAIRNEAAIEPLKPAEGASGHAIILGGVIGPRRPTWSFMSALAEFGISSQVIWWNLMPGTTKTGRSSKARLVHLLTDNPDNRHRATLIGLQIRGFRNRYPELPLYLVATSGGAELGIQACEDCCTDGTQLERVVMLSPCIPTSRRIEAAVKSSCAPVVVYSNPGDKLGELAAKMTGLPQAANGGFPVTSSIINVNYDPTLGEPDYFAEPGHLLCFSDLAIRSVLLPLFKTTPSTPVAKPNFTAPLGPDEHYLVACQGAMSIDNWLSSHPGVALNLRGRTFTLDANLRGANLNGSQLTDAQFSQVDLHGAQFADAELYRTHFEGCNLKEADFRESVLFDTVFDSVQLRGSRMRGAMMSATVFTRSQLNDIPDLEYISFLSYITVDSTTLKQSGVLPEAFLGNIC